MNSIRIVSVGEVLWDLFPGDECLGGAPANFAVHSARNGAAVVFVSAVGEDSRGTQAREILSSYSVDISFIQIKSEFPTGTVGVQLDAQGKPHFQIHENSAWDHLEWSNQFETLIATADAIYFGTLGQRASQSKKTIRRMLELARVRGLRRILDINLRAPFYTNEMLRDSLELATVLKLSDEELPKLLSALGFESTAEPSESLRWIRDKYALDLVAMTRGAAGALLITENDLVDQPGVKVVVQDTVGAGDAFAAALTVHYLLKKSLTEIARISSDVAAQTCTYSGALPPPLLNSSRIQRN
ncbi:carbohydrate kinase [Telmatocola sphagniphila]|uniref:Carbohydrate kinase n=1 Tax=Telmatocola sphagniphila TaxID=1123043 RepID=A0A8E6EW72_9BACT|nr:carbohydrate kinase [Telmatocola sphagniphila]QVL33502.1 carbohydrate kinase [Telmatocola sphagniphila]